MPRPPEKIEIDTFFPRNNFQLFAARWNESRARGECPNTSGSRSFTDRRIAAQIWTTQSSLTIVLILVQNWFKYVSRSKFFAGFYPNFWQQSLLVGFLDVKRTGFVLRFNIDSTSISPVMKVECCLRERNRFGWNVQFPLFWIPQLGWTATPRLSNEFSFYPALDCLLQLTQIYWDIYLNYLWIGAWKAVSIKTLKVYIPTRSLID